MVPPAGIAPSMAGAFFRLDIQRISLMLTPLLLRRASLGIDQKG
jgi:hypothetical protein